MKRGLSSFVEAAAKHQDDVKSMFDHLSTKTCLSRHLASIFPPVPFGVTHRSEEAMRLMANYGSALRKLCSAADGEGNTWLGISFTAEFRAARSFPTNIRRRRASVVNTRAFSAIPVVSPGMQQPP